MTERPPAARAIFWIVAVASLIYAAPLSAQEPAIETGEEGARPPAAASCDSCPQATCRLVCECKEEKKAVWVVECEPFCPLLPKLPSLWPWGKKCHGNCGCPDCEACQPPVHCGKMRIVKKLVKREIPVSVPKYRCVCGTYNCGDGIPPANQAPASPAAIPDPIPGPRPLSPGSQSPSTESAPLLPPRESAL